MAAQPFMSRVVVPWLRCVSRPFIKLISDQSRNGVSRSAMSMSSWKCSSQVGGAWKPTHVGGAAASESILVPRPSLVTFNKELVNTVHLIGRVEDDVKVRRTLAARQAVANVSLAVHNKREPPSWFDLLFWGPWAILAGQHLKKGDLVHVAGKVTVDTHGAYRKRGTVRVFVLDLKFVHGDQSYGSAAMAKSSSRLSGSNTNLEMKQHGGKYHPQLGSKLHPKKACNFRYNNRLN